MYALYRNGTENSDFLLTLLRAGFEFRLRHKNREYFAMTRCAHDLISLKSKYIYLFLTFIAVSYYNV
jgi:hypothetical protein